MRGFYPIVLRGLPTFLLLLYLRGDIGAGGLDLRPIRMRLRLGVGPLQHVGHAHSAGFLLCHGRLCEI